ncbi:MAG: tRNA (adenosine(37)-N6)-threonylcarbamoyltransferase complex dimerization subunit type 1 TsaB [Proteobacteria bacterium]|nr:MAG: tRNA (adenosine(37)-N6)-threonylcarbamoyltransferase complex dimerization subunit type 1 TsaB [Pseudomonadota bacterium]
MKILAIETATEACSAAIYKDGEIFHRYELAPRQHTQLILPMMDAVLAEASVDRSDLDAIAFGRGPGAFTGVRIAVGIAQGLALALDKPLIGISTLAAMAQQVLDTHNVDELRLIPAIDARMNEVYWGCYTSQQGEVALQGEEYVASPEVLLQQSSEKACVLGSGWEMYHAAVFDTSPPWIQQTVKNIFPSAYYVAKLAASAYLRGEQMDAADAEPVYLRNNVAKKKGEQGGTN